MNITYCKPRMGLFSIDRGRIPQAMSADRARQCHERRLGYEAVVGDPDRPRYIVGLFPNAASVQADSVDRSKEGNGDWATVHFLDSKRRWFLHYSFTELRPGKLFLVSAVHRSFVGDTAELAHVKTYSFGEDGRVIMEDVNWATKTTDSRESASTIGENWEEYPLFGDYARLCREERVSI